MSKRNPKVLVVAPGRKTFGGITKVVSYYKLTSFWEKNNVYWIETHVSGSAVAKLIYFVKAFFLFIYFAPKAKIAHIHFTGGTSANRKFVFFVLSKTFGLKVISHIHTPNLNVSAITNYSFKTMIIKSDKVIVLSNIWAEKLNELVEREYLVINNPSSGFTEQNITKEKLILYAGKLESRKGYLDLLKALDKLKDTLNGYKVVLAGNGEIQLAKEFIQKKHLNNVESIGWQDSTSIIDLYNKADIFILPSYGEGFPISIIDALSNKCAVIATPVGGIPDFLTNEENCLYVEPGNIKEITSAIERLVSDDILREKIALNGYLMAKREFDIDKITGKLSEIYSVLLQ